MAADEQQQKAPPTADGPTGLKILKDLIRDRSLLTAMAGMHEALGSIFQITLPRFKPVVVSGPDFNRQVLVSQRDKFSWRGESDPVVKLLRRGVLVVDGEEHDRLRACMEPAMRRAPSLAHIPAMIAYTDQVLAGWPDEGEVDMLVEMRKVALLILLGTLYGTDFSPDLAELWEPILKAIHIISPGPWIVWPDMPRFGSQKELQKLDDYLYGLIDRRRTQGGPEDDLLGRLINEPGLSDDLIRDQLLTMLIAGHDTSTALLAWALYLLGAHPQTLARATAEARAGIVAQELGDDTQAEMPYLDQVIKETLRLFPPIHVGNRFAREDLDLLGYHVPQGTRLMVSNYLTHRDEAVWEEPDAFCPARFDRARRGSEEARRQPLSYTPFGGGPRNCIGATFAQVESRVVLARILQQFDLQLSPGQKVRPYMGATLEPRPGVKMVVRAPAIRRAGKQPKVNSQQSAETGKARMETDVRR
ncbi:MAG: cytochrome P450 [Candidatus Promineifilaceae bacterium]|jgi:cytochrome P450